jgi:3-oxoacyl-[acyl-carrier protein] reductase
MTDARRVAVVMAGSRGLGRACAEALADDGLDLVVCARGAEALEATATELRGRGAAVTTVVADLSEAADVERVVVTAQEAYGRLDVLVVNAGGPPAGTFRELDDAAFQAGFELTQMSAVRAIRAAVPLMTAAGGGRILVIGSSSVRSPIGHLVVSNTFRPGLNGLVKSLAVELAPLGITVNMVSPGKIATDRLRSMEERVAAEHGTSVQEVRRSAVARIPAGRLGEPRELGDAVAYLASERAAYVTGQSLLIDGGMVPNLP